MTPGDFDSSSKERPGSTQGTLVEQIMMRSMWPHFFKFQKMEQLRPREIAKTEGTRADPVVEERYEEVARDASAARWSSRPSPRRGKVRQTCRSRKGFRLLMGRIESTGRKRRRAREARKFKSEPVSSGESRSAGKG